MAAEKNSPGEKKSRKISEIFPEMWFGGARTGRLSLCDAWPFWLGNRKVASQVIGQDEAESQGEEQLERLGEEEDEEEDKATDKEENTQI